MVHSYYVLKVKWNITNKYNPLFLFSLLAFFYSPYYCTSWSADKYSGPSVKMIIFLIILILPNGWTCGLELGRRKSACSLQVKILLWNILTLSSTSVISSPALEFCGLTVLWSFKQLHLWDRACVCWVNGEERGGISGIFFSNVYTFMLPFLFIISST